ncbi:hypothetical protein B566_EDAN007157 [Ephemera danica]|nr:hypothetical protein B566_EDAN007157 [Ephemera danica]
MMRPQMDESERISRVDVTHRVLIGLRFFGQGSYQACVGNDMNHPVGRSTVGSIIEENVSALNLIKNELIKFPTSRQEIDTAKQGLLMCNKYGVLSFQCCDADLFIRNVNAKFPGSTHDSAIWQSSFARDAMYENYFHNGDKNTYCLADSGYPQEPWLLTPILLENTNADEDSYNILQMSARATIERCIGVLKGRFRCLSQYRVLHYHPVKAANIINACSVLHNLARKFRDENMDGWNEPQIHPEADAYTNDDDLLDENPAAVDRRRMLELGKKSRTNYIRNYFSNAE